MKYDIVEFVLSYYVGSLHISGLQETNQEWSGHKSEHYGR